MINSVCMSCGVQGYLTDQDTLRIEECVLISEVS